MRWVAGVLIPWFVVSCGEKKPEVLFLDAVPSEVFVIHGTFQPCQQSEDNGGLPSVNGYYVSVPSVRFRWTSDSTSFNPTRVSLNLNVPGVRQLYCGNNGEKALRLFGLNEAVPPVTSADTCDGGQTSGCVEFSSDVSGQCSLACGSIPLTEDTPPFAVPVTISLHGGQVDENSRETKLLKASKRVRSKYTKPAF